MREGLIWHTCEQQTPEWLAVKNGKIGSSKAAPLLSNPSQGSDGLSKGAWTLVETIAGQILAGEPEEYKFDTHWTRRGCLLEPLAIEAYCNYRLVEVESIGFVEWPGQLAGCSPDGGAVQQSDLGVEIKCLSMPKHIRWLRLKGKETDLAKIDKAHYAQVQWCLYVTGFERWDLVHFHPKAGKGALDIVTVTPDAKMQDRYAEAHEIAQAKVWEIVNEYQL